MTARQTNPDSNRQTNPDSNRQTNPDSKKRAKPPRRKRWRAKLRRMKSLGMKPRWIAWRRRHTRGAGAVLGVLLLAVFAGAALAVHYEARDAEGGRAIDRAAGRVFASWVLAAHRASQTHTATFRAELEHNAGVLLTPDRLRSLDAVPPGLPDRPGRHAALVLGIIPDGSSRRVPMAFGVLEPAMPGRFDALRAGALGAGLRTLQESGGDGPMAIHRPAIETALGRTLASGAIFVTADRGLRYSERALYRRAQPGRPWLNRMEAALAMAPPGTLDPTDPDRRAIRGAGAVTAIGATIAVDVSAGGNADVQGGARAARMTAVTIGAGDLTGPRLAVIADLIVGAATTGRLAAGTAAVSGRLEAGALSTPGALDAAALSAATTVAIAGTTAAGSLAGEELDAADSLRGARITAEGAYGPDAGIDGLMTVGSCAGCEGE